MADQQQQLQPYAPIAPGSNVWCNGTLHVVRPTDGSRPPAPTPCNCPPAP